MYYFRDRQPQKEAEGRRAAQNGFGLDTNPYKAKTNFNRWWTGGHGMVEQSKTPLDHTYSIGDAVRYREVNKREYWINQGEDPCMIIADIIDVPLEDREFNPNIPEEDNFTGVGHHQHLVIAGRRGPPMSGAVVELVDDNVPYNPDADMPTLGSILEKAIKDRQSS